MKNKDSFTLLLLVIIPLFLTAQLNNTDIISHCFADQLHQKMLDEKPHYAAKHQQFEQKTLNLTKAVSSTSPKLMDSHTIPVVVHVIHQNGAENIPDQQVFDAIQQLNEAFANTGFYDPATGVDTEIEFCLAMRDPQNNASNGINRIVSPLTNVTIETQDADLKALLQWNPLDYMNVWVVNEISSAVSGSGVAGYATFPTANGTAEDGIVIEANYTGSSPDDNKVLVHEAGHYLGLYHTFEGGCNNDDCQTSGDRVCDTPPDQSTAPVDCGENINTCDTDEDDTSVNNPFRSLALGGLGDQNDMYINYMDYGHLPCYSAFTEGQKERMNIALTTTRQSLLESYGCLTPCPFASFDASFSSDIPSPVSVGDLLTFTNNSDPANFYEWRVNNQLISNTLNSSYSFDEEGIFTIDLLIRDTINGCESRFEQTIEVICEGEASFSMTSTEILPGETIDFTNTSTGNTSYQWFLDGSLYSTETDISINFTETGFYSLYLIGETSTCSNYSSTVTIIVGSCVGEDKREMHWYFGENAALDFNSGEPVAVSGSQLTAFEGTACISDDNGDLLFYTNGLNIWDATNTVMPNGSDLQGGPLTSSRTQALVIPRPYNPNQYYVFTCDEFENGYSNGIRYSIVDMTLNGGLGDVTDVKNIFLCQASRENMYAAYHDDGQRAWLVIPDGNVLNSYLIDFEGINNPVVFFDPNYIDTWFEGIFFNSGKRLLIKQVEQFGQFNYLWIILNFDNVNGTFSSSIELDIGGDAFTAPVLSPDDSKMYGVLYDGDDINFYQFDLSLTSPSQILASRTLIEEDTYISTLLVAPDGKIYHTDYFTSYLGVINNPNEQGVDCNHNPEFFDLSPATSTLSLPKFIKGQRYYPSVLSPLADLGPDQSICEGLTTVLNPGGGDYDFVWQDGSTDSTYTAWLPGTYSVTATNECGSVTDYITISSEQLDLVDLGTNASLCENTSLTLDAGTQGDFYLWQDGSTQPTLEVSEPGVYSVQVSTQAGCYQEESITVGLDTQAPIVVCPMDFDTIVSSNTNEVLINPGLPEVTDNCTYTLVNDFTNTNEAIANYPAGTTTTLIWTATDENGYISSCNMNITIDISTGLEDFNKEATSLIIYPNPSNGLFILEESQNNVDDLQISIFDALGRKIYEKSAFLQNNLLIDLSEQATGVYFLHWSANGNSGVFKLISEFR